MRRKTDQLARHAYRTPSGPAAGGSRSGAESTRHVASVLSLAYIGRMPDSSSPDTSAADLQLLARRTRSGDRSAFARIHQRLAPGLHRILLRRTAGQADLAEELAQQAWTEVWRALQNGHYDDSKAAISTFVYAVANKMWLRRLRGLRNRPISESDFDLFAFIASDKTENPAALLQASELIDALRACLRATDTPFALTDDERQVITGLATGDSERSLGVALGVAASTIHGRKHAAYAKLRQCLRAKGFSLDSSERPAAAGE
jgi:RNA polymerase sigma-70 factor (ECF subfamily)